MGAGKKVRYFLYTILILGMLASMYFSEDTYLIYTLALVAVLGTLYGIYEIIVNKGFIKNDGAKPSSNLTTESVVTNW